jgi:hypothetical protein
MTASDEVGLRHVGHLGQPRNLRENVLAAYLAAELAPRVCGIQTRHKWRR